MAALTLDLINHNGPTPADVMAPEIITDFRNFTQDFKKLGFCASPVFLQTPDLDFQMKCKIYFYLKRRLWTNEQQSSSFFTLAQVRCFWHCFCFRNGLVALKTSVPSFWIGFAWQYSQACGHPCYLCTFSYPISSFQSTLHLICFETALCEQQALSVMTFCELPSLWRVSVFVFWIIAKSAVFSIIVVSNLYCRDGHLMKPKCKYSNILRYWFLTFVSCKL